jgi:hypothetical protein
MDFGDRAASTPGKHSEFGIASLIIGIVGGIGMVVLIIIATVLHYQGKGQQDFSVALCGLGLIIDVMCLFLGGILGVVGLFIPHRRKVTAIVGLILNVAPFLLFLFLLVVGLMYGTH